MNTYAKGLKIGFLADSLSRNGGGLHEIQLAISKQMTEAGHDVSAFGLLDENFQEDRERWLPIVPYAADSLHLFNFGYSQDLAKRVLNSNVEVFHLHTLWKYSSIIITRWSKRWRAPYVVTPNGMLEPWAQKNSGLKKAIARYLYENRMLRGAACIHANTEKELRDIRESGLKNPIAIIPNGVSLSEIVSHRADAASRSLPRLMLYLGRLHPKKGLPLLLRAWKKSVASDLSVSNYSWSDLDLSDRWQLLIAGWDQNGHELELKKLCDDLGLSREDINADQFVKGVRSEATLPQVTFLGPAFGDVKSQLLAKVDGFVLPSLSEGLPMTILEAWANRLPVLMTESCNLADGLKADAALVCDATEAGIANSLGQFVKLTPERLAHMGQNGRRLVEQKYQWRYVAEEIAKVYAWTLGRSSIPECVHLA